MQINQCKVESFQDEKVSSFGSSPAPGNTFLWGRCLQYYKVQGVGAKWADEETGTPAQCACGHPHRLMCAASLPFLAPPVCTPLLTPRPASPALHLYLLPCPPLWTLMDTFPSLLLPPPYLHRAICTLFSNRNKTCADLSCSFWPLLGTRTAPARPWLRADPCLSRPAPFEHPLLSFSSPVPLPRRAGSLPSSAAIRKWARSHGWVSKPLGKSWIL